jgi:hypothetical protein
MWRFAYTSAMGTFERLAEYVKQSPSEPPRPIDGEQELPLALPQALRALHRTTSGCEVEFVDGSCLLSVDNVLDLLARRELLEEPPGLVPFAMHGNRWALLDTAATFGSPGAVWECPLGELSRGAAEPSASSLEAFVESLLGAQPPR